MVKSYRRRRLTAVTHRVVFGAWETIESILAKRGWKINTAKLPCRVTRGGENPIEDRLNGFMRA